jgi:hypothetical protein
MGNNFTCILLFSSNDYEYAHLFIFAGFPGSYLLIF